MSGMCLAVELSDEEVNVVAVTQSAYMQKNKLKYLLEKIDKILGITVAQRKWSVQGKSCTDTVVDITSSR